MPGPLAFMAGALVGNTLYVAGGQQTMKDAVPSSAFWALDLAQRHRPGFGWKVLPTWPGPPRIVPVAAGQDSTRGGRFYLFSGRETRAGARTNVLSDAYAFDPATQTWKTLPPIGGGRGVSAMAGIAVAADDDEVLLFGGDRADVFFELESHDLAIESLRKQLTTASASERAAREAEIEDHLRAKKKIYNAHPGFGREVFSYSARSDTWRVVARSPVPRAVTTFAAKQGDTILFPSGEIRPGIRTSEVIRAKLVRKP
jgi:N-acetylneuraminic acid mutarotase